MFGASIPIGLAAGAAGAWAWNGIWIATIALRLWWRRADAVR